MRLPSLPPERLSTAPMLMLLLLLLMLASAAPARAQDMTLARNLAATCANCHGTQGRARGALPSLAGTKAEVLLQAMTDYRNGSRPGTLMPQIAKGYTEAQVQRIAAYFAAQEAP